MKSRTTILVAAMALLAGVRVAWPPETPTHAVAEPIVRRPGSMNAGGREPASLANGPTVAIAVDAATPPHPDEDDVPGNAFAVRAPPAPPPPPPPVPQPKPVLAPPVMVAPVLPLTPPPVPLQVIGTYDDGGAAAVFVASPNGTLIARLGSVLLADYQVTGITREQLALLQMSTQRQIELPIPEASRR